MIRICPFCGTEYTPRGLPPAGAGQDVPLASAGICPACLANVCAELGLPSVVPTAQPADEAPPAPPPP